MADSLNNLIEQLTRLPSVGKKSAQRLAFHLLGDKGDLAENLSHAISEAKKRVRFCSACFNYTENEFCSICIDAKRSKEIICVVERPQDVLAFEKSRTFQGLYHVLGGCLSPLDGIGPESLSLDLLSHRVRPGTELILALNSNSEGEATMSFICHMLKDREVRITRLARGIPVGSELDYIDEMTMQRALEGRVHIS